MEIAIYLRYFAVSPAGRVLPACASGTTSPSGGASAWVEASGWRVTSELGLVANMRDIERMVRLNGSTERLYEQTKAYLPREWLTVFWAIPFPQVAKEVLWVCQAR